MVDQSKGFDPFTDDPSETAESRPPGTLIEKPKTIVRMTPMAARKFWNEPIPKDPSGRMVSEEFVDFLDPAAINTPITEDYPDGLWGRFILMRKGRIEDSARVISLRARDVIFVDQAAGAPRREAIENTDKKIRFNMGLLMQEHYQSMYVLKYLFYHKDCISQGGGRFDIEVEDPGGLWRFLGLVQEIQKPVLIRSKTETRKVG